MLYVLRHLFSILLLPATVLVLVPIWIARRWNVVPRWPGDALEWLAAAAGAVLAAVGLLLLASSVYRFASEGRGTLAPWDPPRRLVMRGPYRYVRNPMISGVLVVLVGLALVIRSWPHAIWAAMFAGLNLLFIPLIEEPTLERLFGEDYRAYRRRVPRFIPLVRPWSREDNVDAGGAAMDAGDGWLGRAEFMIGVIVAVLLALAWLYSRAAT